MPGASDLPGLSLWYPSLSLQAGLGYKDNVTLSSYDPQGSGFESLTAEAMLIRLPYDQWQFTALGTFTDTRYFDRSIGVDTEQNATFSGEFTWMPAPGWKVVSTLQYLFINQVMDVSASYAIPIRQQVLGHGITFKQGVRREAGPWYVDLSLAGSRYLFDEPLDDYWQTGPTLTVGRRVAKKTELTLTYSALPLAYDTRAEASARGVPMPGTSLRFLPHSLETGWEQTLDEPGRWRAGLRLQFQRNEDNGSGYYDYWHYRAAGHLRYKPQGWDFLMQASLGYYDYDLQTVSPTDARRRHHALALVSVRGQRVLSRHWRAFANYDFERSLSNLPLEEYQANVISVGAEYTF